MCESHHVCVCITAKAGLCLQEPTQLTIRTYGAPHEGDVNRYIKSLPIKVGIKRPQEFYKRKIRFFAKTFEWKVIS